MTTIVDNKRAFFRINETLELQVRALEERDASSLGKLHRERCAECDQANAIPDKPLERPATMALVGRRYPEILAYVQELERRVPKDGNRTNTQHFGDTDIYKQLVNISGDGIRFTFIEPFANGTVLELIIRLENGFRFVIFAQVVRVEEVSSRSGDSSWNIAAHFTHIRDDDQDELIKFLLSRQMESVRVSSI